MRYETILAMPDSKEKFLKLERKLLGLQHHGAEFFRAKEEWRRLYEVYRAEKQKEERLCGTSIADT